MLNHAITNDFLCLGCEFFKDYKDRDYTAEGLVFNWNQVKVESGQAVIVR